jgi:hypothetical protein
MTFKSLIQTFSTASFPLSSLMEPLNFNLLGSKSPRQKVLKPQIKARPRATPNNEPIAFSKGCTLHFMLEGKLAAGSGTHLSIDGHDLVMDQDTWIFGELSIGAHAKIRGIIIHGHQRLCKSIVVNPR